MRFETYNRFRRREPPSPDIANNSKSIAALSILYGLKETNLCPLSSSIFFTLRIAFSVAGSEAVNPS